MNSIIKRTHRETLHVYIHTFDPVQYPNLLGYAITDPSYAVYINPYKIRKETTTTTFGSEYFYISDYQVDTSVYILVHELLHILGIGLANLYFNNLVFCNDNFEDLIPTDVSMNYFPSQNIEHTSNIIGYTGYNGLLSIFGKNRCY